MDITFASGKLAKICNSEKKLRGEYGPRQAALIMQRLLELAAADSLAEMRLVVAARCHELAGNLAGLLAVDLVHPYRLLFRPADDPPPLKPDGGLDWSRVRAIEIAKIIDYH